MTSENPLILPLFDYRRESEIESQFIRLEVDFLLFDATAQEGNPLVPCKYKKGYESGVSQKLDLEGATFRIYSSLIETKPRYYQLSNSLYLPQILPFNARLIHQISHLGLVIDIGDGNYYLAQNTEKDILNRTSVFQQFIEVDKEYKPLYTHKPQYLVFHEHDLEMAAQSLVAKYVDLSGNK